MKKMMKILTMSVIALSLVACGEQVDVVEKHGFQVLDIEQKEHQSTIVAQVTEFDLTTGGAVAVNIYDTNDIVFLEPEQSGGLDIEDVVLITFEHDSVFKVKKNRLKVGDHVKGQKISDELLNEGAWQ